MGRRRKGTGSVFQRPSGSWAAQIHVGRVKVRRVFGTLEAAQDGLRALIAEHRSGLGVVYRGLGPLTLSSESTTQYVVHSKVIQSVPRKRRFAVLERDGFRCRYCGATAADARIGIDHVVPISAGGSDDEDNLVAACSDCNLGKGDRVLAPAEVAAIVQAALGKRPK